MDEIKNKKRRPLGEYKGYIIRGEMPLETAKKPRKCSINLIGQKFGKLLVIEEIGVLSARRRLWGCLCDCGNKRAATQCCLRDGSIRSCGCLMVEHVLSLPQHNKLASGEAAFNRLFTSYVNNALSRGHSFELSREDFRILVESPCNYCGSLRENKIKAERSQFNGSYYYTGVDRIDNAEGYIKNNVRPCCKKCNLAKHAATEQDFKQWISRAYEYWAHK